MTILKQRQHVLYRESELSQRQSSLEISACGYNLAKILFPLMLPTRCLSLWHTDALAYSNKQLQSRQSETFSKIHDYTWLTSHQKMVKGSAICSEKLQISWVFWGQNQHKRADLMNQVLIYN